MGYFRELPNLEYQSFLSDSLSSQSYLTVKNLFRRNKLRDDLSGVFTLFNKYEIPEGSRPDLVAEEYYGKADLDWVVLMTAGIINVRDEWPLSNYHLYKYADEKYGAALNDIHHYETKEVKDSNGRLILPKEKVVDSDFKLTYLDDGTIYSNDNNLIGVSAQLDTEYNNGPIINVVGNGSDFFKREVTTNGVRMVKQQFQMHG
jgi:hypothetical protein